MLSQTERFAPDSSHSLRQADSYAGIVPLRLSIVAAVASLSHRSRFKLVAAGI
jgi:hypothetical protein